MVYSSPSSFIRAFHPNDVKADEDDVILPEDDPEEASLFLLEIHNLSFAAPHVIGANKGQELKWNKIWALLSVRFLFPSLYIHSPRYASSFCVLGQVGDCRLHRCVCTADLSSVEQHPLHQFTTSFHQEAKRMQYVPESSPGHQFWTQQCLV